MQSLIQLGALILLDLTYVFMQRSYEKAKLDLRRFSSRCIAICVLVDASALIEPLLPGVPITQITILYFAGVLLADMIGLASNDGVPVPTVLVTATRILRSTTEAATRVAPSPDPPVQDDRPVRITAHASMSGHHMRVSRRPTATHKHL